MIEISYHNVMNALNKSIHMTLLSPTQCETDRLFRRAKDLWYIKGFSLVKSSERSIEYGPDNDKILIRFKELNSFSNGSWRGFRGIFLFHPDINPKSILESRELKAMDNHNERYMDQWRA